MIKFKEIYISKFTAKHHKNIYIEEIIDYLYYQQHDKSRAWRTMKLYVADYILDK